MSNVFTPFNKQSRLKFTSASSGFTDSERLLIDSIRRRAPKKRLLNVAPEKLDSVNERSVVALSTAEEYNLDSVQSAIVNHGVYEKVDYVYDNELDDVLHFTAKYKLDQKPREFFVFREGSIVFWNMSSSEVCFICACIILFLIQLFSV